MVVTCPVCKTSYNVGEEDFAYSINEDGNLILQCSSCQHTWVSSLESLRFDSSGNKLLAKTLPNNVPGMISSSLQKKIASVNSWDKNAANDSSGNKAVIAKPDSFRDNEEDITWKKLFLRNKINISVAFLVVIFVVCSALFYFVISEDQYNDGEYINSSSNDLQNTTVDNSKIGTISSIGILSLNHDFQYVDGKMFLIVYGEVVSSVQTSVPASVFIHLKDANGLDIYSWSVPVGDDVLYPGKKHKFVGSLDYVPEGIAKIEAEVVLGKTL